MGVSESPLDRADTCGMNTYEVLINFQKPQTAVSRGNAAKASAPIFVRGFHGLGVLGLRVGFV